MIFRTVTTQKIFDQLMQATKDGKVTRTQTEHAMMFSRGESEHWTIDFPAFYNFFREEKHGEDPVTWGK